LPEDSAKGLSATELGGENLFAESYLVFWGFLPRTSVEMTLFIADFSETIYALPITHVISNLTKGG